MLPFESYTPTRLILAPDAENQVGQQIENYQGKNVLLHYGGSSAEKSGLLERVRKSLQKHNLRVTELGGVLPNPRASLVYKGIELCQTNEIDFVLAVGGGSVLDSAKAIAIGACYEGDFWDLYVHGVKATRRLGLGTIITLPATGSEASNSSVIKNDLLDIKRGLRSDLNRPDFSLINPQLTYTLSNWQIACGAVDIISHVLERYFAPTDRIGLSDRLCEALVKSVIAETPLALANPEQYDVQANLFWSSTIAHIGWLGMGREEDWSVHAMEHEISGNFDSAHGAGLSALYPAWMSYILHKDAKSIPRLSRLAEKVFAVEESLEPLEKAKAGIEKLTQTYQSWGMPVNLAALDVPYEILPKLATDAKKRPDGFAGSFSPLNEADFLEIYRLAWSWHK